MKRKNQRAYLHKRLSPCLINVHRARKIPKKVVSHVAVEKSSSLHKLRDIQESSRRDLRAKGISKAQFDALSGIVVIFFADGSEEFSAMTACALKSFLEHTPRVQAGLLTPDRATRNRILGALSPSLLGRVDCRLTRAGGHLGVRWNPTQFKLDVLQFLAGHYDTFVWMDSDTLVFRDMTSFLLTFVSQQEKNVFLVADHATHDPNFVQRWKGIAGPYAVPVPQACLMGFKRPVLQDLFDAWRDAWVEYLTPAPFARLADPAPEETHSAFCIEQYALALALTRGGYGATVMWFDRGSHDVKPSRRPVRPVLGVEFALRDDFESGVEERWHRIYVDHPVPAPAAIAADAAGVVSFRSVSSYGSTHGSSYGTSSYNGRASVVGDAGLVVQPTLVSGVRVVEVAERREEVVSRRKRQQATERVYEVRDLPAMVRVDVFGGCVYHVYSQFFFYVLDNLVVKK